MTGRPLDPVPGTTRLRPWPRLAEAALLALGVATTLLSPPPAAGAPRPAAGAPAAEGWKEPPLPQTLPDTLTLTGAVRWALEVDPEVAAARAARENAAAGVRAARSDRLPSLSTSAQISRFEEPMVVAPIHALDLARAPEFDRTLVQGRLELGYTLWDGGARGARLDGARASETARAAGTTSVRQDVTARVVDAYLTVLTARDVVAAQEARFVELEAERERVNRFLEEGTAPRLELLRAEAELASADADHTTARARLERAESRLASLLEVDADGVAGMDLREVAPAASDTAESPAAPDDVAELDIEGVDQHPALAAARARLDAARARERQSRSAWLPRLRAQGAFVEYGGGTAEYTGEWQAGLRLEYPLFTGGARSAEVERAGAEIREAEAELRRIRRELGQAVDAARSAEREARARATSLSRAVARFEELARVEALALEEGVGVQRDFLRAQAGLLQARAGLAEARRAVLLARTRAARALGVLTLEWIERTLEPSS